MPPTFGAPRSWAWSTECFPKETGSRAPRRSLRRSGTLRAEPALPAIGRKWPRHTWITAQSTVTTRWAYFDTSALARWAEADVASPDARAQTGRTAVEQLIAEPSLALA